MKNALVQHQSFLILGCILIITFLTYKGTLNNGFIDNWDDNHHILNNDHIKSINPENLKNVFRSSYVHMYQPLTELSYAMDYFLVELDPFGYHLTNLLLHFAVVVMVYILLLKLDCTPIQSGLITILFATSPLSTEPVAWISARSTLLSAFFLLAGLSLYIDYLTYRKRIYFILTLILYTLSLFTRITAVVFPFLILSVELYVGAQWKSKDLIVKKLFLLLISVPIIWIGLGFRYISDYQEGVQHIPFYILPKIIWYLDFWIPIHSHSLLYQWPKWFDIRHLSSLAFIIIVTWIFLKISVSRKMIVFGILFFLVSIGPYLIYSVDMSPVADRYGYIPFFGIYFIIGSVIFYCLNSKNAKLIVSASTLLLALVSLNIRSSTKYIDKWNNSFEIWDHSSKTVPGKSFIHSKLGGLYFSNQQYSEAESEWLIAYQIDPSDEIMAFNLGSLKYFHGNYQESINYYNEAINIRPSPMYYSARARAYYNLNMYKEAIQNFNQSISLLEKPDAELYYLRGISKIETGDPPCMDLNIALKLGNNQALSKIVKHCR